MGLIAGGGSVDCLSKWRICLSGGFGIGGDVRVAKE